MGGTVRHPGKKEAPQGTRLRVRETDWLAGAAGFRTSASGNLRPAGVNAVGKSCFVTSHTRNWSFLTRHEKLAVRGHVVGFVVSAEKGECPFRRFGRLVSGLKSAFSPSTYSLSSPGRGPTWCNLIPGVMQEHRCAAQRSITQTTLPSADQAARLPSCSGRTIIFGWSATV